MSMRLGDLYDMLGELSDARIISGSAFYANDETLKRLEQLRAQGYKIVSLGNGRFRCEADPVSGTLRTDGAPFANNKQTQQERYRLSRQGFAFRRMQKGVFICIKRPTFTQPAKAKPQQEVDATILIGNPFHAGPSGSHTRKRIEFLRRRGNTIRALGRGMFVHEANPSS
ncbi:MAG: hypothetical protein WD795_05165 [Woeseia sp.]